MQGMALKRAAPSIHQPEHECSCDETMTISFRLTTSEE